MSIRGNIELVMQAIQDDASVGDDVQAKAVEAIKDGQGTDAWQAYMKMFAKNAAQMARLMPTDATEGVFAMDVARTYLVGNGMCGAETTGFNLLDHVGDTLDEGLSS